ncbi:TPA: hypothetical protein I8235_001681 [Kluyvera intermedia]|nr:hypothetical protein [Kluyvera intermedia]
MSKSDKLNYGALIFAFAWFVLYQACDSDYFSLSKKEIDIFRGGLNVLMASVVLIVTYAERIKYIIFRSLINDGYSSPVTDTKKLFIAYCLAIAPFSAAITDLNRAGISIKIFDAFFWVMFLLMAIECLLVLFYENDQYVKKNLVYPIIALIFFCVAIVATSESVFPVLYRCYYGIS